MLWLRARSEIISSQAPKDIFLLHFMQYCINSVTSAKLKVSEIWNCASNKYFIKAESKWSNLDSQSLYLLYGIWHDRRERKARKWQKMLIRCTCDDGSQVAINLLVAREKFRWNDFFRSIPKRSPTNPLRRLLIKVKLGRSQCNTRLTSFVLICFLLLAHSHRNLINGGARATQEEGVNVSIFDFDVASLLKFTRTEQRRRL